MEILTCSMACRTTIILGDGNATMSFLKQLAFFKYLHLHTLNNMGNRATK